MKSILIVIISICFALTGCERKISKTGDGFKIAQMTSEEQNNSTLQNVKPMTETRYFPLAFGSEESHLLFPFPSNWKMPDQSYSNVAIEGPHGIKVFQPVQLNHFHYKNESQNNNIRNLGYSIAPVSEIDSFISDRIQPVLDSADIQIINKFELTDGRSIIETYEALLISALKSEATITRKVAIEGVNTEGIRSLIVIEHYIKKFDDMTSWGAILHSMEAPALKYNEAKTIFLKSVYNFQPCFQEIFYHNKTEIWAVTNNQTAQYFTPKQEKERRARIRAEEDRTGNYEYDTFEKYIERLQKRGIHIDQLAVEASREIHASVEKENEHKKYIDDYLYDPQDSTNVNEHKYVPYN